MSKSVTSFFSDRCLVTPGREIGGYEVYEIYKAWCLDFGYRKLYPSEFLEQFSELIAAKGCYATLRRKAFVFCNLVVIPF
ncbi:primase-like DNA-binding domain-containing protein [Chroococcidiopsis sp.]|uniref:primase-like DNA-binding domain-containing protein n=1 Tax=Chroococcidiopsis sp. TaxID=3088168 RepID=UPI003F40A228